MIKRLSVILAAVLAFTLEIAAQDRLRTLPGYDAAQRVAREAPLAVTGGVTNVTWIDEGRAFEYERDGKHYRYDVGQRRASAIDKTIDDTPGRAVGGPIGDDPDRGRQAASTPSPDGMLKAFYKDRNIWISSATGRDVRAITTDGSVDGRIKYGTASWVYGEELSQRTAMWWSPDGRQLAYYRFDERDVRDYYVALDQTQRQATLDTEAFPQAGTANPTVDLYIYDVATGQSMAVDVRSGPPFDGASVGHYVYRVQWSADGRELLFLRSNRRQNVQEVAAADPSSGACRVVLREEWP